PGVVTGQPGGQGDKGAEAKEIVQGKAPHPDIAQGFQLLRQAGAFGAAFTACNRGRVILGHHPKDHRHHHQHNGIDPRGALPAHGRHNQRGAKVGDGRADLADAKQAEHGTVLAHRIPAGDKGNAGGKYRSGHAQPQRRNQQTGIALHGGQNAGGQGADQHGQGTDQEPAEPFAGNAQQQSGNGAGQHRHGNQQPELGFGQSQLFLNSDADNGEQNPGGKGNSPQEGGHKQHARG